MTTSARVLAVATSVPPYELGQSDVMRRIELALGPRSREIVRLLPMFGNTGIERRYSCVPIEWYEQLHDWPERNQVYLDSALDLLESATRRVLQRAGREPHEIDAIVAVSTTGIATPSLDALLMERMQLPRTIKRLPIFGLGCAGGTIGLARAATMARSNPGSLVLFLVVELCALCFRRDDFSKSNIVATALFGDGAAAALLSSSGKGPQVVAGGEHTWPETLDVMGWEVTPDGFKAVFSRDIPELVTTKLHEVVVSFLSENGLTLRDIDSFVCHPGGAKVIEALEVAFELKPGSLATARDVLRDYGNMSAATVMFVLERLLEGTAPWRRALVSALGPGFTAGFTLLANEAPS
ncbi:MAG: 3-oxoacyl-[acyl-carrier-protein] synthase III C-terminal domain-containing protein [Candidatus Baltobacteraceae bacterium]